MRNDHWKTIKRTVLLGAQRAQLPEKLKQALRSYSLKTSNTETEAILQSLSLFHLLKKGAGRLAQLNELPQTVPTENTEQAPKSLAPLLGKMLSDETYHPIIPEYLQLSSDHGFLLAPESLYYLFEYYKEELDLVAQIQELMGNAGLWLCRQNPAWAIFNPTSQDQLWDLGTAEDRRQALIQIRMDNPAKAQELLQQSWPSEPWRNQLLFLSTLVFEANEEDIPFLKNCLQSKSKDIRLLAGKILCSIPAAQYNEQIAQLLLEILDVNGEQLSFRSVINQEKLEHLSLKLGYHATNADWRKEKNGFLAALQFFISQMAPSYWERLLQRNSAASLKYLQDSAYFPRLQSGLAQSIHLHQDVEWMPLFIKSLLELPRSHWDHEAILRLASNLPFSVFDQLSRDYTSFHKNIVPPGSLMYFILLKNEHSWPHQLSLNIIQIFQDYLQYSNSYFGDDAAHYEDLLDTIALRTDPTLFTRLQIGWPEGSFSWYRWEAQVQKMLRILHFRSALHQAFEKESA